MKSRLISFQSLTLINLQLFSRSGYDDSLLCLSLLKNHLSGPASVFPRWWRHTLEVIFISSSAAPHSFHKRSTNAPACGTSLPEKICSLHAQLLEKLLLSSSFWKVWSVEQNTFKTNVKELKKHEIHTRPPSTSLRWGSQGCCSLRVCWGEGCFTMDMLSVHHRATQTDKQHSNSHLFNN